jgi:hypothetical protein
VNNDLAYGELKNSALKRATVFSFGLSPAAMRGIAATSPRAQYS